MPAFVTINILHNKTFNQLHAQFTDTEISYDLLTVATLTVVQFNKLYK